MMVVFGGGIKWPEQTGNLESKQRWTVPQNEYVEKKVRVKRKWELGEQTEVDHATEWIWIKM